MDRTDSRKILSSKTSFQVLPEWLATRQLVFARKDTSIVELIPDHYMTPLFKQLSVDCGHRYHAVMGKAQDKAPHIPDDMNWDVNLESLDHVFKIPSSLN